MKYLVVVTLLFLSVTSYSQVNVEYMKGSSIHESCGYIGEKETTQFDSAAVFVLSNGDEQLMRIYMVSSSGNTQFDMELYNVQKTVEIGIEYYTITNYGPDGQLTICEIHQHPETAIYISDNSHACAYLYTGDISINNLTYVLLETEANN